MSIRQPLAMIAAMGSNRVIGADGKLPWREPEDARYFKTITTGHAVIMGRKTWESLKLLPKRRNLVVTRQAGLTAAGAEVFASLDDAIRAARSSDPEPMIIGGGEIYRLALSQVTRIYLTEVHGEFPGDATFPLLPPDQWQVASERTSGNLIFRVYERM